MHWYNPQSRTVENTPAPSPAFVSGVQPEAL
jgi:hypothetical protein